MPGIIGKFVCVAQIPSEVQKMNGVVHKTIKKLPMRKGVQQPVLTWSGLTREEAFDLETECLQRIQSTYQCICCPFAPRQHFPVLISSDRPSYSFTMSSCGKSLKRLQTWRRKGKVYLSNDPTELAFTKQVECIVHNLRRARVQHLDVYPKNICIDPKGVLSLIDFDMASIEGKCLSVKLERVARKYIKDEAYLDVLSNDLLVYSRSVLDLQIYKSRFSFLST